MNTEQKRINRNIREIKMAQMKELYYIGYFVSFALEYVIKSIFLWRNAYNDVSFVVERNKRKNFSGFVNHRKPFNWMRYI